MVSTRTPTSKSSSPFSNPLLTIPNAPITIGIIVICMFYSFFNSLAISRYLSFFIHSFSFILWSTGTAKSTMLQVLFFCCWLLLGLVVWPRLGGPCVCQSLIGVYACYFLGKVLACAYTVCSYGQIKMSCSFSSGSPCRLVLYSFCANLLHSLIMWLLLLLLLRLLLLCLRVPLNRQQFKLYVGINFSPKRLKNFVCRDVYIFLHRKLWSIQIRKSSR